MLKEQLPLGLEETTRTIGPTKPLLRSFKPRLESPAEALDGEGRARHQEEALLAWFRLSPGRSYTPSEVHSLCGLECPLTSIRRALTNLTDRGDLKHHITEKRVGPWGSRESCWSLAEEGSVAR